MAAPVVLVGQHEGVDRASLLRIPLGLACVAVMIVVGGGLTRLVLSAVMSSSQVPTTAAGLVGLFGGLALAHEVTRRWLPIARPRPRLEISREWIRYWPDESHVVTRPPAFDHANAIKSCSPGISMATIHFTNGVERVFLYYDSAPPTDEKLPRPGRYALVERGGFLGVDYLFMVDEGRGVHPIL